MWYKALVTVGTLLCALGLTRLAGLTPPCSLQICEEVFAEYFTQAH